MSKETVITELREKKKKALLNKAKKLIAKDQDKTKGGQGDILFISDLIAYLGVSTSTFYEYFPADSEEMDIIKDLIERERVNRKVSLRKKMFASTNAVSHVALYKLLGTDEERAILNQQDVKLSGSINASVTAKQEIKFKTRPFKGLKSKDE